MDYTIRKMRKEEYPQLKDFLYEAVYVPEGTAHPDRAIIDSPELQVYIRGFGTSRHDHALAAVVDGGRESWMTMDILMMKHRPLQYPYTMDIEIRESGQHC